MDAVLAGFVMARLTHVPTLVAAAPVAWHCLGWFLFFVVTLGLALLTALRGL
jgi:hypothetical protein